MIVIDVQIPFLNEIYDFEVNEDDTTENVTSVILQLLYEKKNNPNFLSQKLFFYAMQRGMILNQEDTLKQQGIVNGERLIMI